MEEYILRRISELQFIESNAREHCDFEMAYQCDNVIEELKTVLNYK